MLGHLIRLTISLEVNPFSWKRQTRAWAKTFDPPWRGSEFKALKSFHKAAPTGSHLAKASKHETLRAAGCGYVQCRWRAK
jgi:hypothetical protein